MTEWRVRTHKLIRREAVEAADFYDTVSPSSGAAFTTALVRTLRKLDNYPRSRREYIRGWRRLKVDGFPYIIIYGVRGKTIYAATLQNQLRDPATIKRTIRERPIRRKEDYDPFQNQWG